MLYLRDPVRFGPVSRAVAQASRADFAKLDDFVGRRRHIIQSGLDPAGRAGVEIGPLSTPLVAKAEGAILYVDHVDTEALRVKFSEVDGFDLSTILPVDIALGERSLLEALGFARTDYIIASHVAEHVPDLIGWLASLHEALADDGEIRLVIPDKRFSFDALREETRLSDVLSNWFTHEARPTVRDVMDFMLGYAPGVDGWGLYEGRCSLGDFQPRHDFARVLRFAAEVRDTSRYRDVHCWAFRPIGFARIMAEITGRGLLPLACAALSNTVWPMLEFFVILEPCADAAAAARSWSEAAGALSEAVPGSAGALAPPRPAEASPRVAEDDEALRAALAERDRARAGMAAAEAQAAALSTRLAAIEASRSWRLLHRLRRLGRRVTHGA